MLVSYYPDSVTTAGQALELPEVLAGIKEGRWREQVEAARAVAGDKAAYDRAKRKLPGFTTSGTFSARADGKLLAHSGLLCLDIDAKDANASINLAAARASIEADSYAYAVAASVGGVGFCVLVPIPPDDHKGSFRALAAYFLAAHGVTVDASCSNVSRLRFVSYDPALYLNEEAATFEETLPEPQVAARAARQAPAHHLAGPDLRNADTEATLIAIGCKMIREAQDGGKYVKVLHAAHTVGGYVGSGFVDAGRAYDALHAEVLAKENVADLKNAEKALHSGLYKTGPAKPLLPDWLQLRVRRELRDARQAYGTVVSLASDIATQAHVPLTSVQAAVQAIAEEQQQALALLTFWNLLPSASTKRDAPPKLVLSDNKYLSWLAGAGFRKYRTGEGSYLTVQVRANIVHRQDSGQLRDFVNAYLEGLPFEFDGGVYRFQVQDLVHGKDGKYFDPKFLQNLPSLEQPFLRDERELAYFFFANCWVRVGADERQAYPYDELPGLIWAEQVRTHHVVLISRSAAEQCDFHTFTANVSARDAARLTVLQHALGYLLHGYKEELNARCVIFLDEVATTGKPDGRTGKSLLIRAVGELIKVTLIPGATFRFEDGFRFSRVELDTRILYFDEWDGRRLPFKKLFTEIVSELAVNKKNQPEFIIPFADGPKFAMTTNDVLLGDGSSHEGRKLEIPLAPHYSATHTPKDEFGRGFFREGWEDDVAEYNRFFNLALFWVQGFLKSGRQLVQLPSATLAARKLEQETGTEFIEFAAELLAAGVPAGEPGIWVEDALKRYQTETGDKRITLRRFNNWFERLGFSRKRWEKRDWREKQFYMIPPLAAPRT
ncbi:hypothetical protein E4631_06140 [Hymenobacter sp. UV11]|uniref:BT4734/BF3469 family protein n=1 Tax=Hymenobacter sp. UV11 TaxID=1849735 RepID=UPI0010605C84|nr:BT4734/BF3469 family protein [Hymenobacter sp. UV11]TDN38266.1 hypothetical protein A8B98_24995 [Hymenobacter sp. UV11]TFZ67557.1 hypothetical protein E4631_06140 [Hymenobacter sp. UV11]